KPTAIAATFISVNNYVGQYASRILGRYPASRTGRFIAGDDQVSQCGGSRNNCYSSAAVTGHGLLIDLYDARHIGIAARNGKTVQHGMFVHDVAVVGITHANHYVVSIVDIISLASDFAGEYGFIRIPITCSEHFLLAIKSAVQLHMGHHDKRIIPCVLAGSTV